MGPIERDLQARKEEIRSGELVSGDYRKFNKLHDINTYAGHYILEDTLIALLDELEEEHKTEIPQPVDADGVPWTGEEEKFICNDETRGICSIRYNFKRRHWEIYGPLHYVAAADTCRHVKPKRSLEEIARDFDKKFQNKDGWNVSDLITELHEYFADDAGDKS